MGLDVMHYKATVEKIESSYSLQYNCMTESDFEYQGFDVPFGYFKNYIQMIDIPETVITIYVPYEGHETDEIKSYFEENARREFKFWHKKDEVRDAEEFKSYLEEKFKDKRFLKVDKTNLEESVKKILREENLLDCMVSYNKIRDWIYIDVYRLKQEKGFYYEGVGYQRKDMNANFNKYYDSDICCYAKKEEFEFALTCVEFFDYCSEDETGEKTLKAKELFKKDFVDSYEEGKSFMWVSC